MAFNAGAIEGTATLDRSPFIDALRDLQRRADEFSKKKIRPGIELNTTRADVALQKLRTKLDRMSQMRVSPTVAIDDRAALAKLAAIDAAVKKVDADAAKASGRGGGGRGGVGLLGLALATLGSTVGPLAATLGSAFAAGTVGAAGLAVAVLGIKDAVKENTVLGQQYLTQGNSLNILFKQLKQTGAESLFASTADGAKQLKNAFPGLNQQVQEFATIGGDVANNALRLILTLLQKSNPELVHFGTFINGLLEKANAWASGTGFDKFLAYVDKEGPIVAQALGSVSGALIHMFSAVTPFGNLTFRSLTLISNFIKAAPPEVINALAVAWAAWAISMKAADVAQSSIGGKLGLGAASFTKIGIGVTAAAAAYALLSSEGNKMVDSQSGLQSSLGGTIRLVTDYHDTTKAFSNFVKGDFAGAFRALDKIFDPHGLKAQAAEISYAFHSLGGVIDKQYNKTLDAAAKKQSELFNSVNYKQSLSGLSGQIGDVTTNMQKQLETEQSLDGIGKGRIINVQGQKYSQEEFNKALVLTNGNYAKAVGLIEANRVASYGLAQNIVELNAEQQRVNDAVGAAQSKYKLTTDQVDLYASAIGVTGQALASGAVSSDQFVAGLGRVIGTLQNANTANAAWLASVDQFNKSGKTAADVGNLIAAALQAARGIALDFATTNLTAATAVGAVSQAIKDNTKSVSDNGTLLGQLVKVGDTWQIQQPKLSAGSLAIAQSLTQQATAAQTMASQTYQNEVSTRGASRAAHDALGVYLGYRSELIKQAEQSGLTRRQAEGLANQYLAVPKNVKTFISQIGKKDVATAISDLTSALNHFSRIVARASVGLNGADVANSALDGIISKIGRINSTPVNPKSPNTGKGASIPGVNAAGTQGGLPDGWSTVGEGDPNTWELLHKSGSKVDVYSNRDARKMLPGGPGTAMVPGYAGGTVNGIRYATDLSYHNALVRAQQRADKAAAAQVKARQTGERSLASEVGGDIRSLRGAQNASSGSIASLTNQLLNEVQKAASYHVASSALVRMVSHESVQLRQEVAKRASIANQLKAANDRLAAVNQNIAQEKATVRSAVLGTFDIGTSGNGYQAGILASLTSKAKDATKFQALLAKAKNLGLNPALIAQLAEEGPATAGKNLEAIVNAGKDYISQVNAQYHQLGVAADAAGATAASAKYGAEQAKDIAAVKKYTSQMATENRRIHSILSTLSRQFSSLETALVRASRTKR